MVEGGFKSVRVHTNLKSEYLTLELKVGSHEKIVQLRGYNSGYSSVLYKL